MATTDKRLVFQRPDGVLIVRFLPKGEEFLEGESEAMYLDGKALKNPPPGCVRVDTAGVSMATLAAVHRWRDCLRWQGGTVTVDLPLARQQVLDEAMTERDDRMGKAHGQWIHAKIKLDNVKAKTIEDYCAVLELVPTSVQTDLAAITTVEGLAAYVPTWPIL